MQLLALRMRTSGTNWPAQLSRSKARTIRKTSQLVLLVCAISSVEPSAHALPSYARQTGQRCSACHVGGNWPQLTPWGRFFKLAGYTAGKEFIDREGFEYVPLGVLGQAGITWAAQPNNSQGQPILTQNATPEFYGATAELGTKLTNWAGVFAEYGVSNTFPGLERRIGANGYPRYSFLSSRKSRTPGRLRQQQRPKRAVRV